VDRLLAQAKVSRHLENATVDRKPAEAGDSGQVETLADGSISIPIFEEEIVVTKRMVVRERLIVRKERRSEQVTVPLELTRERVEIEADPAVRSRIRKG
jgi:stress response protein YsnF